MVAAGWELRGPSKANASLHPSCTLAERAVKLVTIRGERHSGTGWLRGTLLKNCQLEWLKPGQGSLDADGKYGWKHSELHSKLDPGDFLIVVTRNASTWLPKIQAEPYAAAVPGKRSMHEFLQARWPKQPNIGESAWTNVTEMRTGKYLQWLSYSSRHPRMSVVLRYEDLVADFPAVLRRLASEFCVPCWTHRYEPVSSYYKFLTETSRAFSPSQEETRSLARWRPVDWRKACHGLDLSLEARLGYTLNCSDTPGGGSGGPGLEMPAVRHNITRFALSRGRVYGGSAPGMRPPSARAAMPPSRRAGTQPLATQLRARAAAPSHHPTSGSVLREKPKPVYPVSG